MWFLLYYMSITVLYIPVYPVGAAIHCAHGRAKQCPFLIRFYDENTSSVGTDVSRPSGQSTADEDVILSVPTISITNSLYPQCHRFFLYKACVGFAAEKARMFQQALMERDCGCQAFNHILIECALHPCNGLIACLGPYNQF